jgi:aryl-alcohol dehydrogenase-like predicted oxidoreductase
MEYRLFGLSGCAVSALALGTLTFGNETSETDSLAQLDRQILDTVRKVAEGLGASMSQVVIAWVLARPAVRSVILGTRTWLSLTPTWAPPTWSLPTTTPGCLTWPATWAPPTTPTASLARPARPPHLGRRF